MSDPGNNWDADPWILGVGNGVLNLKTGELRPGRPDDRISKHAAVPFDPTAKCPRWLQFLGEIFEGNPELIPWIQMASGYTLTGDTSEQVLFMLYGGGANGKTTFLNVLRAIVGDYGYNMPFSTLERRGRTEIGNDVAALAGRRFVSASETNESERLNEARIKALTGGDAMTARFLRAEFFTFRPVAKFWLAVNHKPVVSDDSVGFWRRVRLVPFTRQFTGDQEDKRLEAKLLEEAPGILAWMVQGCLEWQQRGGLRMPESIKKATDDYREEMDHMNDFLAECCVVKPDAGVAAASIWQVYVDWCRESRVRQLSRNEFATRLKARGCDNSGRQHGGKTVWRGIGLVGGEPGEGR